MEDTIFLLVKVLIDQQDVKVHEAVKELQKDGVCLITDTQNVRVVTSQIMDYKLKS